MKIPDDCSDFSVTFGNVTVAVRFDSDEDYYVVQIIDVSVDGSVYVKMTEDGVNLLLDAMHWLVEE
jgi:hypothetical protein